MSAADEVQVTVSEPEVKSAEGDATSNRQRAATTGSPALGKVKFSEDRQKRARLTRNLLKEHTNMKKSADKSAAGAGDNTQGEGEGDDEIADEHWNRFTFQNGSTQYGARAVGGQRPKNKAHYDSVESVDYTIPDTVDEAVFARIMQRESEGVFSRASLRRAFLWAMYFIIGVTVSLIITIILLACDGILKLRVDDVKKKLYKNDVGGAWLSWTGSSFILCGIALACVLIEPAAASSGIPGLIAYLNGVEPRGGKSPITGKQTSFVSWQTMVAKSIGMVASIPSGLCIGPEGPIIHISALIAHWTSILVQDLEAFLFPGHQFTARKNEARDFLATGAACGICTAFRAPLAGVLFVVEEAASFFTTQHLEFTFLASLTAYMTAWAIQYDVDGDSFVKFAQTTGYFCSSNDGLDYILFMFVGVIGGLLGSFFNDIVEHLNHLRVHHINHSVCKRVSEVAFLCILTGTIAVLLPAAFDCEKEYRTIMMKDSPGCLNAEDRYQISHGEISHSYLSSLLNRTNTSSCTSADPDMVADIMSKVNTYRVSSEYNSSADADVIWLDNQDTAKSYIHLHYVHTYNCGKKSHKYNGMSMLWLNGGVKAVKVLMQRGFPYMLSWQVLLVFCIIYFLLAAITAGTGVPAGLVVPMLLIGGSYGRLMGLVAIEAKKSRCGSTYTDVNQDLITDAYYWSTEARWALRSCRIPDPGTYAMVGMASFLGGSGRITVMLATVLLELTDDASMIAPIGIVCVLAMLVGNLRNHGLYHGLIPVFSIPFLNPNPPLEASLAQVQDVMALNLVTLSKTSTVRALEELVVECRKGDTDRTKGITHHAFPVIYSPSDTRLVGLLSRKQLEQALLAAYDGDHAFNFVHLIKYCDRSPVTVYPHTRLNRAYNLFRKLGMRHLVVVDNSGCAVGMITRKELMAYLLTDQKNKELIKIRRAQMAMRRFLRNKFKRLKNLVVQFDRDNSGLLEPDEIRECLVYLLDKEHDTVLNEHELGELLADAHSDPHTTGRAGLDFQGLGWAIYRMRKFLRRRRLIEEARESHYEAMQANAEQDSTDDSKVSS